MDYRNDLNNDHYDEQYKRNSDELYGSDIQKRLITGLILVLAAIVLIACYMKYRSNGGSIIDGAVEKVGDVVIGEEGVVTTINEFELKNIVREAKLYTAEYPYNDYARVYNDKGEYYVAYNGSVVAGIEADKIEISLDEDTHTVIVRLPEVTVEEPTVDIKSLDYIFKDKKAEKENISGEAYKVATEDLKQKVRDDENLRTFAADSAKSVVKALIEPWTEASDEKYSVIVLADGEEMPEIFLETTSKEVAQ